jgi:hypothetical protein
MKIEVKGGRSQRPIIKLNGKEEPHVTAVTIRLDFMEPPRVDVEYLPSEVLAQIDDPNIERSP